MWVQSLGWEDPLEEGTATHSSILAWRISWTEEPGRIQSMGSQSQIPLKQLSSHRCTQRTLKGLGEEWNLESLDKVWRQSIKGIHVLECELFHMQALIDCLQLYE